MRKPVRKPVKTPISHPLSIVAPEGVNVKKLPDIKFKQFEVIVLKGPAPRDMRPKPTQICVTPEWHVVGYAHDANGRIIGTIVENTRTHETRVIWHTGGTRYVS